MIVYMNICGTHLSLKKCLTNVQVGQNFLIQLDPCNLNFCNSKDHLNRTNSSVPSEFTSKALQENTLIRTHIIRKTT